MLGWHRMVHEQEDSQSRKRSYPFINWIQTQSPEPDSKRSPEPDNDSYKPPIPSPPLQSLKCRSVKSELNTFAAKPNIHENGHFESRKEKVKFSQFGLLDS